MGKDWRKIILKDERQFQYGEIYLIKDELMPLPEDDFVFRVYKKRPVVVTQHCLSNLNPDIWVVNVAFISSQIQYQRDTDLLIDKNSTNKLIYNQGLIRLGMSMPVLKIDLEGSTGELSPDQKLDLSTLQAKLAGIDLEEN